MGQINFFYDDDVVVVGSDRVTIAIVIILVIITIIIVIHIVTSIATIVNAMEHFRYIKIQLGSEA